MALLVGVLSGCATSSPTEGRLNGQVLDPLPEVGAMSLPDAPSGSPFTFSASPGGILLVYFGYTSCPDICPTTLSAVRTALKQLGSDADRVQLAMVTVDPKRDTGSVLTRYLDSFVPGAHALRTDDDEQLLAVADAFGASYAVSTGPGGSEEVAHTTFLYAVDDQGRIRVQWPFGVQASEVASDLRILLGEHGA